MPRARVPGFLPLFVLLAAGVAGTAHAGKKDSKPPPPLPESFEDDEEDEFQFDPGADDLHTDPVEDFDLETVDDLGSDPVEDFDLDSDLEEQDLTEFEERPVNAGGAYMRGTAPVSTLGIQLDVVGKVPLADNYEAVIVATDRDAVVVELPVLLGRSRADFDGVAFWLVAEVLVDGLKVGESRQQVTSASLAQFGPSFMFLKMLAPVSAKSGALEVRLSKASAVAAKPTPLFSRTVAYTLP